MIELHVVYMGLRKLYLLFNVFYMVTLIVSSGNQDIDQANARPVRVLDKINGVFTCTICDVLVMDRYSLQDHWYGNDHKKNMKLVQVIAGPEERLAMKRPVVQEMLCRQCSCRSLH